MKDITFDESVKIQKAISWLLMNDPVVRHAAEISTSSLESALMISLQHGELIKSRIYEVAEKMEVTDRDRSEGYPPQKAEPMEKDSKESQEPPVHPFVYSLELNRLAARQEGKLLQQLNIALMVGGNQTVCCPDEQSQQLFADRLTGMAFDRGLEPMLDYNDDGMYVEWDGAKITIRTMEQLQKLAGGTIQIASLSDKEESDE